MQNISRSKFWWVLVISATGSHGFPSKPSNSLVSFHKLFISFIGGSWEPLGCSLSSRLEASDSSSCSSEHPASFGIAHASSWRSHTAQVSSPAFALPLAQYPRGPWTPRFARRILFTQIFLSTPCRKFEKAGGVKGPNDLFMKKIYERKDRLINF